MFQKGKDLMSVLLKYVEESLTVEELNMIEPNKLITLEQLASDIQIPHQDRNENVQLQVELMQKKKELNLQREILLKRIEEKKRRLKKKPKRYRYSNNGKLSPKSYRNNKKKYLYHRW